MEGYRRGREGPMDWELTPGVSAAASSSRLPSLHNTDNAMDLTFQDESIRDVSMGDAEEDATTTQTIDAVDKSPSRTIDEADEIEEIPRGHASSSGNSSASHLRLVSSKTARRRPNKIRRRRGSHSSAGSSVTEGEERKSSVGHWPLAPVVGTVINYLVPPVSAQTATSATPFSPQSQSRESSRSNGAARKALTTLHPRERPLLLLSYAQLAFNSSLLLLTAYVLFALVWTIRLDVVERLREIEDAYHHSITTCQRSHSLNCLVVPLPPALIAACDEWDRCSRKKLTEVLGGSRLRVVIEVLSEAWEVGVGGLGWRTLGFSLLLLSVVVGGANSTLNGLRMGVLKKSQRRRQMNGHTDEDEEVEQEEGERRRVRRDRVESERMALPPTTSYPYQQALGPPSPHQSHYAYAHRHYPAYAVSTPPLTPSFRAGLTSKKAGRKSTLDNASRFGSVFRATGVGNREVMEEWVDEE